MIHGGPTAAARPEMQVGTQYWTSRGFAVVDVNYRGSTGYARAYRALLQGTWGIADVEDCVAAARFLAERGDDDSDRLCILDRQILREEKSVDVRVGNRDGSKNQKKKQQNNQ